MQFFDMLIIAPCSSKKCVPVPIGLHADAFRASTLDAYARQWVKRVRDSKERFLPDQVYAGQGIAAAREASEHLNAKLHILSAGLSMVAPTRRIPGYNLTVSHEGPGPFDRICEYASAADWWLSLNRAFGWKAPLAAVIKKHEAEVIIALPASYLAMVASELTEIATIQHKKLRLIASVNTPLNAELDKIAIRYDSRLNTVDGAPRGANTSFIQRSLLHFSRLLIENPRIHAVASQQELVSKALGAPIVRSKPRKRMADEEILKIVSRALAKNVVSCAKLLEVIRREKNIACEQHRFRCIYDQALSMGK